MARYYQALGDITRLRLLNLLDGQELCVCFFVEVLGVPQPKISRHLAVLRSAGVVSARRQGTWIHYRIMLPAHAGAARILRDTLGWMKEDQSMKDDRTRLASACCALHKYEALQSAPIPTPIDAIEAR